MSYKELPTTDPTTAELSSTEKPSPEITSGPSSMKPTTEDLKGEHKTGLYLETLHRALQCYNFGHHLSLWIYYI